MNLAELGELAVAAGDLAPALCAAWNDEPADDPTQIEIRDLVRNFYDRFSGTLTDDHLRILTHLDGCRLCQSSNLIRHVHNGVNDVDRVVAQMLRDEFESRIDFLKSHGLVSPAASKKVRISHLGKGVVRVFRETDQLPVPKNPPREIAFIGSSSEGLPIARALQSLLRNDLRSVVWDQGSVFGLGEATIESLENAVHKFDYGIFVFTPDDELIKRENQQSVARDNVIFELGLFIGKLSRRRAFLVNPSKGAIALPSDLLGMSTSTYDPEELQGDLHEADEESLAIALGPVSQEIRIALKRIRRRNRMDECA